jgi:hypothetical protein
MSNAGEQFKKGFEKGFVQAPPPIQRIAGRPPVWLETIVGFVALWILIAAVAQKQTIDGITLAIVGLAVTTIWCCLYMARR